ncbi:transposase [Elysia marginata]|uniref:Transposase n=1 Tax=Elysia marginata TaxID=1093978 RepID=A0AAV4J3M9_9GAST|nr:transposase [Elysia marginata]
MFTVFWDMEEEVQMEFLEQGQTMNSERYISTLQALKRRLRRVRRDKDSILQHDNKRPHTSRQTQDGFKVDGAHDPTATCIQAPLNIICFPNSRSILRAITMTMMFADGAGGQSPDIFCQRRAPASEMLEAVGGYIAT